MHRREESTLEREKHNETKSALTSLHYFCFSSEFAFSFVPVGLEIYSVAVCHVKINIFKARCISIEQN